jgi:hypothetical protein
MVQKEAQLSLDFMKKTKTAKIRCVQQLKILPFNVSPEVKKLDPVA